MALTTAEHFAVSGHLTEWPDHYNYDQILTAVESGCDDDVFVWEQFENNLPSDIVESIENTRITFIRYVADMTEDLREAIKDGDQQAIADRMIALENQLGVKNV